MAKELFLQGAEDMKWLLETHLKGRTDTPLTFGSSIIVGNEDCPSTITLFLVENPSIADKPLAVYEIDEDMNYIKRG